MNGSSSMREQIPKQSRIELLMKPYWNNKYNCYDFVIDFRNIINTLMLDWLFGKKKEEPKKKKAEADDKVGGWWYA